MGRPNALLLLIITSMPMTLQSLAAGGAAAGSEAMSVTPGIAAIELDSFDLGLQPLYEPQPDRPALPKATADMVFELEQSIAGAELSALRLDGVAVREAELDRVQSVAMRIVELRAPHQSALWRTADGAEAEWYELADARRRAASIDELRTLSEADRHQLLEVFDRAPDDPRVFDRRHATRAIAFSDLAWAAAVLGDDHALFIDLLSRHLITFRRSGGEASGELALLRQCAEVLGAEHPISVSIAVNIAQGHDLDKTWQESILRTAIARRARVLGPRHPDTVEASLALADRLPRGFGDAVYARLLPIAESVLGEDHHLTTRAHRRLAMGALYRSGDPSEPLWQKFRRRALEDGAGSRQAIEVLVAEAGTLTTSGDHASALSVAREGLGQLRWSTWPISPLQLPIYTLNSLGLTVEAWWYTAAIAGREEQSHFPPQMRGQSLTNADFVQVEAAWMAAAATEAREAVSPFAARLRLMDPRSVMISHSMSRDAMPAEILRDAQALDEAAELFALLSKFRILGDEAQRPSGYLAGVRWLQGDYLGSLDALKADRTPLDGAAQGGREPRPEQEAAARSRLAARTATVSLRAGLAESAAVLLMASPLARQSDLHPADHALLASAHLDVALARSSRQGEEEAIDALARSGRLLASTPVPASSAALVRSQRVAAVGRSSLVTPVTPYRDGYHRAFASDDLAEIAARLMQADAGDLQGHTTDKPASVALALLDLRRRTRALSLLEQHPTRLAAAFSAAGLQASADALEGARSARAQARRELQTLTYQLQLADSAANDMRGRMWLLSLEATEPLQDFVIEDQEDFIGVAALRGHFAYDAELLGELIPAEVYRDLHNAASEQEKRLSKRLPEVEAAAERTEIAVRSALAEVYPTVDPNRPLEIPVSEGRVILTGAWLDDRVVLVAVDTDGIAAAVGCTGVSEVRELARLLRTPSSHETRAAIVSSMLTGDVRAAVERAKEIVVVAQDRLSAIPFEDLVSPKPCFRATSLGLAGSADFTSPVAPVDSGRIWIQGGHRDASPAPAPSPPDIGLVVAAITPGGNADQAGVKLLDVLVEYNGAPMDSVYSYRQAQSAGMRAARAQSGESSVPAVVWRSGARVETTLSPGAMQVSLVENPKKTFKPIQRTSADPEIVATAASAEACRQSHETEAAFQPIAARNDVISGFEAPLGDGDRVSRERVESLLLDRPLSVAVIDAPVAAGERRGLGPASIQLSDSPAGTDSGYLGADDIALDWAGRLRECGIIVLTDPFDPTTSTWSGISIPEAFGLAGARYMLMPIGKSDIKRKRDVLDAFLVELGRGQPIEAAWMTAGQSGGRHGDAGHAFGGWALVAVGAQATQP